MFATIGQWNHALAAGEPVRKSQHDVGAAAMHHIRAVLRAALNVAVRDGLMPINPPSRVRMPPDRKPLPLVWTAERTEAFWAGHARRVAESAGKADPFKIWCDKSLRPGPMMVGPRRRRARSSTTRPAPTVAAVRDDRRDRHALH